eukprot:764851-Hanusia_phi.AAC.14
MLAATSHGGDAWNVLAACLSLKRTCSQSIASGANHCAIGNSAPIVDYLCFMLEDLLQPEKVFVVRHLRSKYPEPCFLQVLEWNVFARLSPSRLPRQGSLIVMVELRECESLSRR